MQIGRKGDRKLGTMKRNKRKRGAGEGPHIELGCHRFLFLISQTVESALPTILCIAESALLIN